MEQDFDGATGLTTGVPRPQGLAFSMRSEAEAVLRDPAFHRSPTIAKLLRFLIEETLAGRAHLLKSYSVAVDGLDRSTDFDSSDSYARVQMGRLRKMLQVYYAEHGPVEDLCLYLPSGHYIVRMGPLATAYPKLYRPLSATAPAIASPDIAEAVAAPIPLSPSYARFWRYAAVGTALLLLATIVVGIAYWYRERAIDARFSPILELMPVEAPGKDPQNIAGLVGASLNDGLVRFKISRVRDRRNNPTALPRDSREPVYQLHTQVFAPDGLPVMLYLRLNDGRTHTQIWSREITIQAPVTPRSVNDAIAPLIPRINGPYGVIATHSAILYKDNRGGGYPCLLNYLAFLKNRDIATERQVETCFKKPVGEPRLRALILATRSFFALESSAGLKDRSAALARAEIFADRAIAEDENDAVARFAKARVAYLKRDCLSALFYSQQTVDASPHNPIFLPVVAAHAPYCGYHRPDLLLDRAVVVAEPGDTGSRLLLVIASVAQNRPDLINELDQANAPREGRHLRNYYLTETIIAASRNQKERSARYWRLFCGPGPRDRGSAEQMLKETIESPILRREVAEYLAGRNVFAVG